MKKHILLSICILSINLIACTYNHQPKNNFSITDQDTMISLTLIKSQIELQNSIESDELEFENPYSLSYKDLEIEKDLIYNALIRRGYQAISDTIFNKKINDIFQISVETNCRQIIKSSNYIVYVGDTLDGNRETIEANIFELPNITKNIFFVKNIMLEMLLIKDFVKIQDNNTYTINVPNYIYYRNKYLFNESNSSLTWLLQMINYLWSH